MKRIIEERYEIQREHRFADQMSGVRAGDCLWKDRQKVLLRGMQEQISQPHRERIYQNTFKDNQSS